MFSPRRRGRHFSSRSHEQHEGGLSEVTLNRAEGVLILRRPGETASHRLAAQFIGFLDVREARWQWAWCSEEASDLDPATLRFAGIIRNYGIQNEIPELTYEMIPLGFGDDRPWFNVDYLLMATAHLCQADFYVAMSFDEAQNYLMFWLVQAPELLPQPPSESRRFFDVIRDAMPHWASALKGAVGREVVRAYSDQKGYRVSAAEQRSPAHRHTFGRASLRSIRRLRKHCRARTSGRMPIPAREGILASPPVRSEGRKRRPIVSDARFGSEPGLSSLLEAFMPWVIGFGVVALVVLALVAFIATRPSDFRYERSAQMTVLAMSSLRSSTTFASGSGGRPLTSAIPT